MQSNWKQLCFIAGNGDKKRTRRVSTSDDTEEIDRTEIDNAPEPEPEPESASPPPAPEPDVSGSTIYSNLDRGDVVDDQITRLLVDNDFWYEQFAAQRHRFTQRIRSFLRRDLRAGSSSSESGDDMIVTVYVMSRRVYPPPNQMDSPMATIYGVYRARLHRLLSGAVDCVVNVPPRNIVKMPSVAVFAQITEVVHEDAPYEWKDMYSILRPKLQVGTRIPFRSDYVDASFHFRRAPDMDDDTRNPYDSMENLFIASDSTADTVVFFP